MDKISVALISGIIVLMLTSGIIIYNTWLSDEMNHMQAETIVEDSMMIWYLTMILLLRIILTRNCGYE